MPEAQADIPIVQSPGLDRGFALAGPAATQIYVRPVGLLSGAAARAACASGKALPLAGGPLAFTHAEVLRREESRIVSVIASHAELADWRNAMGPAAARHIETLLDRLSSPRPAFAGLTLDRPRAMAILNVTPDSFSDGGEYAAAAEAIVRGKALVAAGADIIDVGGESTRPGAQPVDPQEELARVRPVLDGLREVSVVRSIDTRRALVMAGALDAGAAIVNDVSALAGDPESLPLTAARNCFVVLMHMQGKPATMNKAPRYAFAPLDVYDTLSARVAACVAAGIPRGRIAVDPGLGFGKTASHNLQILERLTLFHGLGCALLLGASRKLVFGGPARETPLKARLGASLGAALAALEQGIQILRVHDLVETRQAMEAWRAIHGDC